MPGTSIPDFRRHSVTIAMAGIYDQQLHHDQVLLPTLKYWKVFDREDLRGSGDQARDELVTALAGLKKSADRFVEKRTKRAAASRRPI